MLLYVRNIQRDYLIVSCVWFFIRFGLSLSVCVCFVLPFISCLFFIFILFLALALMNGRVRSAHAQKSILCIIAVCRDAYWTTIKQKHEVWIDIKRFDQFRIHSTKRLSGQEERERRVKNKQTNKYVGMRARDCKYGRTYAVRLWHKYERVNECEIKNGPRRNEKWNFTVFAIALTQPYTATVRAIWHANVISFIRSIGLRCFFRCLCVYTTNSCSLSMNVCNKRKWLRLTFL